MSFTPVAERAGDGFSPDLRLRCRREFDLAWEKGRRRHTPHFIVLLRVRQEGPTRLGVTASRKIGGAVARNRVKRLVREFFRRHYAQLPVGHDLSVVAKRGAAELDYRGVCEELGMLLTGSPAPERPWPGKLSSD